MKIAGRLELTSKEKTKRKLNIKLIAKQFKFYDKKTLNNQNLYLDYKKVNDQFKYNYPKSVNKSNSSEISELINEYEKRNHFVSGNFIPKKALFKRTPLLCIDQKEINDYYYKGDYNTNHYPVSSVKEIRTLNRFASSANDKIDILEGNLYKLKNRSCSQIKHRKKYTNKILKENMNHEKDITLLNNMIEQSEQEKINETLAKANKTYLQFNKPYVISNNISSYIKNKFLTIEPMNKSLSTKSQLTTLTQRSKWYKGNSYFNISLKNYHQRKISGKLDHDTIEDNKETNPCIKTNSSIVIPEEKVSKSVTHSKRLSMTSTEEPNCDTLYHQTKDHQFFNRRTDSKETLDKLSSYLNESISPQYDLKGILRSLNIMKESIKEAKIYQKVRKLHDHFIPANTKASLNVINSLDKTISASSRVLLKNFTKLKTPLD